MLLMAVFLLGGGGLISIVFSSIAGGGVEQSFIYPIYAGIIVLAGLIVGAVDIIVNEIRELKKQWKRNESRKKEPKIRFLFRSYGYICCKSRNRKRKNHRKGENCG